MNELERPTNALSLGEAAEQAAREGRGDEAVALWESALAIDPRDTGNLIALTNHLAAKGDGSGAVARCAATLQAFPDLYPIWMHMGILQYNCLSNIDGALQSLQTCVGICEGYKPAHGALAELYCLAHDPDKMRLHAKLALSEPNTGIDLYIIMRCLSDYELCAMQSKRLLLETPDNLDILRMLGKSLRMLGQYDEARDVLTRAAELGPLHFDIHHQLGELMILTGDLVGGWRQIEKAAIDISLRSCDPYAEALHDRRWRGQPLQNKRLILKQYAGFGDSFMFARYGECLRAAGAHVTFACNPSLVRLMSQQRGFDAVTDNMSSESWAEFDYWAVDYFVAPYLGAADGIIYGADSPSISPPAPETAYWRDRLGSDRGNLRVGLCWASAPHHFYGLDRSIPAELLSRLAEIEGVNWFAVQKFSDHRKVRDAFGGRLIDHSSEWSDFADSAGMISQLDLLISIDSGPLHLAGAMNVPVWGLIPFAPEWRWGLTGEESPWYPTLRLFRQPRLHAWDEVVARVKSELMNFVSQRKIPGQGVMA